MILRYRHEIAAFNALLIIAIILALPHIQVERTHELPPPPMQVTLAAAPAPAPAPAKPPPPPAPPVAKPPPPVPAPVTPPSPVATPAPPPPTKAVAESAAHPLAPPPKPVTPAKPARPRIVKAHLKPAPPRPAVPTVTQRAAPAPPAAPAAPAAPAPAPTVSPAAAAAPVNTAYTGLVRAQIEAAKHYPTGREALTQHPQGVSEVWFTLDRSGRLIDAGIENASGSMILDRNALETVQRGSYPPFPADSFPGEAQHRFTISLAYTTPSS